jgi:hypothetical protein
MKGKFSNLRILVTLAVIIVAVAGFALYRWRQESRSQISSANLDKLGHFVNQSLVETRDQPPSQQNNGTVGNDTPTSTAKQTTSKQTAPAAPPSSPGAPGSTLICPGQDAQNFDCYQTYYMQLVQQGGVQAAFADLRARYGANGYVVSQCHPLVHVIGRAAVDKYPNVAEAYAQGDSFCWSGYYHGVLEGVIGRIGPSHLNAQLNSICTPLTVAPYKKYGFDHYNCAHGLGHGIMAISNDELFDSLKTCDVLNDQWERLSCWSGVFMENVIVDNKNHFTKFLTPSDPLYPCDAVEPAYRNTCYMMQTSYMLKVENHDFNKVFGLCATVGPQYTDTCYQSLGRDVSGLSSSNVAQTIAGCNLGKDLQQRTNCFIGAVKDFISYYHSDTQGKALCSAITEKEVQDTCFSTAADYYKSL